MDTQESSSTPQFKNINFSVLSLLYGPTLISICDNWKNHSFDYTDFCQQSNTSKLASEKQMDDKTLCISDVAFG